LVLANAFPELLLGGNNIKNVVDHLKGQAQGPAEPGQVGQGAGIRPGGHRTEPEGSGDEGTGFCAMNLDEFFQWDALLFRIQIEDLSGNQTQTPGGVGKFRHEIGGGVAPVGFDSGHGGKSLRQQAVARQHRHGLPIDLVVGRAAAAEIVIVHTREVIVDQRVGVDTFDGAGPGQSVRLPTACGPCRGEAKDRSEAFSAGQEAVAHGLVNQPRMAVPGD